MKLDLRSLACLRICFGLILLLDLVVRATDLQAHYTDWGVAPRADLLERNWHPAFWSLHLFAGSWLWIALLFAATGCAYVALMLGYRTHWAGILSWALLISMQNRNPMILDGGDLYFRCLLFWLMFSSWGECWSLDVGWRTRRSEVGGVAEYCYVGQLALIYLFAFAHKSAPEWHAQGSAVEYALQIEQLTTPLAPWLLQFPASLKILTHAVLWFEGLVPFLVWHQRTRLLAVVGLTALHGGFGLFMHLGAFGWIALTASWGLLPGWVWDRLGQTRWGQRLRPNEEDLTFAARPLPRCRRVTQAVLVFLFFRCLQFDALDWHGRYRLLFPHDLYALRLDQKWNMFSPKPLLEDGWYVFVGETVDGQEVDPWRMRAAVDWSKPAHLAADYPNARWRKLMMNLWDRQQWPWRQPVMAYLVRRWNAQHPDQPLRCLRMYFVLEKTLPQQQTAPLEVRSMAYYGAQTWFVEGEAEAYPALEGAAGVADVVRSAAQASERK